MTEKPKDPLHGKTLEVLLTEVSGYYGWEQLSVHIPVRCFMFDPTIKSSLIFLRRTPWARKRIEDLWLSLKKEGHL